MINISHKWSTSDVKMLIFLNNKYFQFVSFNCIVFINNNFFNKLKTDILYNN